MLHLSLDTKKCVKSVIILSWRSCRLPEPRAGSHSGVDEADQTGAERSALKTHLFSQRGQRFSFIAPRHTHVVVRCKKPSPNDQMLLKIRESGSKQTEKTLGCEMSLTEILCKLQPVNNSVWVFLTTKSSFLAVYISRGIAGDLTITLFFWFSSCNWNSLRWICFSQRIAAVLKVLTKSPRMKNSYKAFLSLLCEKCQG